LNSTQETSKKSLSYWEYKAYFHQIDFAIVGAGIVGMSAAFHIKRHFPNKKVVLIDGSTFSDGASFKNAGFACFGSAGELLSDMEKTDLATTINTASLRIKGLKALDGWLGMKHIDYQACGSYELFTSTEKEEYEKCCSTLDTLNIGFKEAGLFQKDVFSIVSPQLGLEKSFPYTIYNQYEGKIDTAKLNIMALQSLNSTGIPIIKGLKVKAFNETNQGVYVQTKDFDFITQKLILATNGFSKTLLPDLNIEPARAQVLISEPLEKLNLNSTYHLNQGYDYFRMIDDRLLVGGGRNLAMDEENTDQFGLTSKIQDHLENLLQTIVHPRDKKVKIDFRWSGIMGVGQEKAPLIGNHSPNISYGIRMGGMGVAIGTLIGKTLADRLLEKDKA
jgi:glycine/D-amino acid oxidase-like deaminating enzyme